MTAIVEVGPHTLRGPDPVPESLVAAALDGVDDPVALVGDEAVPVRELWGDVLRTACGDTASTAVVVAPTWWPAGRVDVVATAAGDVFADPVVVRRASLLEDDDVTVLEFAPDHAVITAPACDPAVVARDSPDLAQHLPAAGCVLVDIPAGVAEPSPDLVAQLRQRGISLRRSTPRLVDAAAAAMLTRRSPVPIARVRLRVSPRVAAVLTGAAVTTAAVAGGWAAEMRTASPSEATRLLVEGRVAVRVPARWPADRVTTGPGSARVRVAAPNGLPALHITQSVGGAVELPEVAASLRRALEREPDGVFADFDPAGERAGRPAVTYVERRSDTVTRWAVLTDGEVRIAIGCQDEPAREQFAQECVDAVRSAHAVN